MVCYISAVTDTGKVFVAIMGYGQRSVFKS